MAHRNQAALDMIGQLRARLTDLEQDVLAYEGDLPDLAGKLDKIDDRVYLLESELAKKLQAHQGAEEAPADQQAPAAADEAPAESGDKAAAASSGEAAGDGEAGDNGLNILTPEAKQKIGETVGDMREIGREAAETFTSLNEAFGDITAPFKSFMKPGRRH